MSPKSFAVAASITEGSIWVNMISTAARLMLAESGAVIEIIPRAKSTKVSALVAPR